MTPAETREARVEFIRRRPEFVSVYPSRGQVLFAALTVEDAVWHVRNIEPVPQHAFAVYEVYATKFFTLDRNWLDFETSDDPTRGVQYAIQYWYGEISNHNPPVGDRRPPRLEVLIPLPVTIGRRVALVEPTAA